MWNINLKFLPLTFCCCHKLKTGGIAIGWAGLIFSPVLWWTLTSTISTASMHGILIGGTIGGLLGIAINGCLIYGSTQNNWMCIIPWLIYAPIEFIVGVCGMIETIHDMARHFNSYSFIHPPLVMLVLFYSIFLVILIYWWFCLFSLLKSLRDDEFLLRSKSLNKYKNQTDEETGALYDNMEAAA